MIIQKKKSKQKVQRMSYNKKKNLILTNYNKKTLKNKNKKKPF